MKKSKPKKNMSLEAASDFWDEHDFFEFKDAREVDEIKFQLRPKKYIGVDQVLYKKILKKAKKAHKSGEALINEWLENRVS